MPSTSRQGCWAILRDRGLPNLTIWHTGGDDRQPIPRGRSFTRTCAGCTTANKTSPASCGPAAGTCCRREGSSSSCPFTTSRASHDRTSTWRAGRQASSALWRRRRGSRSRRWPPVPGHSRWTRSASITSICTNGDRAPAGIGRLDRRVTRQVPKGGCEHHHEQQHPPVPVVRRSANSCRAVLTKPSPSSSPTISCRASPASSPCVGNSRRPRITTREATGWK